MVCRTDRRAGARAGRVAARRRDLTSGCDVFVLGPASGKERQAVSTEENKQLVLRWKEELWGRRNLNVVDALCGPDYVGRISGVPGPVRGREALKQLVAAYFAAFDVDDTPEFLVAEDDMVVIHDTYRFKHTGAFQGIPATGKEASITGTDIYRIADGKIVEQWVEGDLLGVDEAEVAEGVSLARSVSAGRRSAAPAAVGWHALAGPAVHEPAISYSVPAGAGGLGQQRREPLDPSVDGHVDDLNPSFNQQLLNVAVRQPEAQAPADREDDDVWWEAEAREGRPCGRSGTEAMRSHTGSLAART